jgi:hypothetical protein
MQERSEKFLSIRDGMTEAEVRAKLGPPDEVRPVSSEHLLDGVRMLSSDGKPETHRWAYGPSQPSGFARGGIVSFDASGSVVDARCPPSGPLKRWSVSSERVRPSGGDISVKVERVRLEEARGESSRCWWIRITASNHGTEVFSRKCFWSSFDRQVAVEIFDKNGVLFREDMSRVQNGVLSMDSAFILPAGVSKTEDIAFMPDDYLGLLPPGTYYVRAYFAETAESFVASKLYRMTVENKAKTTDKAYSLKPNKSLQPTPGGVWVCSSRFSSGVAEVGR